jgi:hypothetical protein
MQRPPQNATPPTVTTPDNTELPADWQVYKPDPTKPVMDILQLEIAPKLASGTATKAERDFYERSRPPHWASVAEWGKEPAPDPAQQQQTPPVPQQQQTTDVKSLAVAADEQADKLASDFQTLFDEIDAHAASIFEQERKRLKDAGAMDADGNAKLLADQAKDEKRREVFKQHEQRLVAAISKLQEHERVAAERAQLADCLGDKPSSLNLATLAGLGTDERQKYAAQLTGMNPASLRAVALQAEATGNRVLAAAVKVANDALPKDARLFSSTQLADKIFGAEALEIWQSAILTRNAVQRTVALLRQLESGRSNPVAKISRGLAAQSAGKRVPMPAPNERLGDNHNLSRISRGLRAMAAAENGGNES